MIDFDYLVSHHWMNVDVQRAAAEASPTSAVRQGGARDGRRSDTAVFLVALAFSQAQREGRWGGIAGWYVCCFRCANALEVCHTNTSCSLPTT